MLLIVIYQILIEIICVATLLSLRPNGLAFLRNYGPIRNIYRNRYSFSTRLAPARTIVMPRRSRYKSHHRSVAGVKPVHTRRPDRRTAGTQKWDNIGKWDGTFAGHCREASGGWPGADGRLECIVIARIVWCAPDDSESTPGLPASCLNFVSSTSPRRTVAGGNERRWFTGSFPVTRVRNLPPFHLPRRMSHSS